MNQQDAIERARDFAVAKFPIRELPVTVVFVSPQIIEEMRANLSKEAGAYVNVNPHWAITFGYKRYNKALEQVCEYTCLVYVDDASGATELGGTL